LQHRLYRIAGTDRGFDGYNFFGGRPEIPTLWFRQARPLTRAGFEPQP
jgi:hypothetical protein